MAEQILKRAFDYSHSISDQKYSHQGGTNLILTLKEIKELEKKESSINML
jgi:hypothetical protein